MFYVRGGIYKDMNFNKVVTAEEYGPFKSREEALETWKNKMWGNVDNALHRLRIEG